MRDGFPLGKGPLVMMVMFVIASGFVLGPREKGDKEVLEFWVFAATHYDEYKAREALFEEAHPGVDVRITNFGGTMHDKLLASLLADFGAPDLAEVEITSIGRFLKGRIEHVGFQDLRPRLEAEGWLEKHVQARFAPWSFQGHIFGLPHDLHPVVLLYRDDLFREAGVDLSQIETWDEFVEAGRKVGGDLDGDGRIDRYALGLSRRTRGDMFVLLLQRGGGMFDANGDIVIDDPVAADTLDFYRRLFDEGIARDYAGTGGFTEPATFALMEDGVICAVMSPDWYVGILKKYTSPQMDGKWRAMGLPAWTPGGRRTTTMGGTMIGMTKQCDNPGLAWEFMKFSYFDTAALVNRYEQTRIIPPLKEAFSNPVFHEPDPFLGEQRLGTLFTELALQLPPRYQNPYWSEAADVFDEVVLNAVDGRVAPNEALADLAVQVEKIMAEDRLSGGL